MGCLSVFVLGGLRGALELPRRQRMACVALSIGEGLKRLHKAALTYLPFFFAAFLAAFFAVFLVAFGFFAASGFHLLCCRLLGCFLKRFSWMPW